MLKKPILLLSLSALLCLTACDEGLGVNITFKSKDKDTGSSQAVSVDVDGKDVRLNHAASDVSYLEDGRKVTVSSGDSVTINPPEKEIGNRIPESFAGVWVSLLDAPITESDAVQICHSSYDNNYQERSWIKDIDTKKQEIINVFNYEDIVSNTPVNYRINTSNAIAGQAKYEAFEMGMDQPVETKTINFNYQLDGNRLYSVEDMVNGKQTVEFIKCANR